MNDTIGSKANKTYKYLDDNIVVIDSSITTDNLTSLFCPVCDFIMNSARDNSFFLVYECCADCGTKWAECRKDEWKNGWRPSDDEISSEIDARKQISPNFQI